jgi:DNA-binding response OmpR family regulator
VSSEILVVDDEAKIVRLVRSYLEQSGFVVVEANDGQIALIQARREKPDLVCSTSAYPALTVWRSPEPCAASAKRRSSC